MSRPRWRSPAKPHGALPSYIGLTPGMFCPQRSAHSRYKRTQQEGVGVSLHLAALRKPNPPPLTAHKVHNTAAAAFFYDTVAWRFCLLRVRERVCGWPSQSTDQVAWEGREGGRGACFADGGRGDTPARRTMSRAGVRTNQASPDDRGGPADICI